MRRKVLQDYINGFCTWAVSSPGYYDTPRILHEGPGRYSLDILRGTTKHNGVEINPLHQIGFYKEWLDRRAGIDHIDVRLIESCVLEFNIDIIFLQVMTRNYSNSSSTAVSVCHEIFSNGHISTDQKTYFGYADETSYWGVGDWARHFKNATDLLEIYPYSLHTIVGYQPPKKQTLD